jgi:hypothetical protein
MNPNEISWTNPELRRWILHYQDFLNSGGSAYILNRANNFGGTQPPAG